MSGADNEAVMARLKKLLALATPGRGASPAEVEQAMRRAQELAAEHNISLSSVNADGDIKVDAIETDISEVHTKTKIEQLHHLPILAVLRECFGVQTICDTYTDHNMQRHLTRVSIVGEKLDVQLATYCWAWLEEMFPRAWLSYRKAHNIADGWVPRRSYMQGFRDGIIQSNRRVKDSFKGQERDRYALVVKTKDEVVKARFDEAFPDRRNITAFQQREDRGTRAGGEADGRKVRLSSAITGGSKREALT